MMVWDQQANTSLKIAKLAISFVSSFAAAGRHEMWRILKMIVVSLV